MYAVTIRQPGPPDELVWAQVAEPAPDAGEVVVEVAAAGVNRADILQRQGKYDPPAGQPAWPGLECSGRIIELGTGVDGWTVGDEVCALLSGGGYAERVSVPAGQLLPVPVGMDLVTAAALPEVTCTVWSNVFMLAGLRPGETFLVHGGASGIGTMAIQLARHVGARVACTAGSAAKLAVCRELGATITINYRDEDFVAALQREAPSGADVILDNMGAAYLARNLTAIATNGRLAIIGFQGGTRAELDLGALMAKRAAVFSTSLRSRPAGEKATIVSSVRANVWPLVEAGIVRPVVDRTLAMTEASAAHQVMEAGEHVGKVLLVRP